MNKKAIAGGVAVAVIIGIIVTYYTGQSAIEKSNLDLERHSGTVDTSMGSPILGSLNAPVTIVEFGDYQCPKCDQWFREVRPSVEDNYIKTGKASLVFVDLAFFGPDSTKAAEASYCAGDQSKYWQYHSLLYSNQGQINDGWANTDNLKKFASQLGLNMDLFNNCLDGDIYKNRVAHNVQVAKDNGASGTPTFVIVNSKGEQKRIDGAQPYSIFEQTLDAMS